MGDAPWLQKKSSRRSTVKSDLELFCMGRWAYQKQDPLGNQTKGATDFQCRSVKLIPSLFLQKVPWFFLRTWKAWVAVALAMMRRNLRCTSEKSYWNPPMDHEKKWIAKVGRGLRWRNTQVKPPSLSSFASTSELGIVWGNRSCFGNGTMGVVWFMFPEINDLPLLVELPYRCRTYIDLGVSPII